MKLFGEAQVPARIIQKDGMVTYFGPIFDDATSDTYLKKLLQETPWQRDEVVLYGKHIITERKICWYGTENYEYTYSNKTRTAIPWTETLLLLKSKVEAISGTTYNSCLLNLYENGNQGLSWHSDKESLGPDSSIASLSFGEERRFDFKHKVNRETISIFLEHGSLLLMEGWVQDFWKHQLPKSKKIHGPRINLTFRKI